MFLGNLNGNERQAFLNLANAIMNADGKITEDEKAVFERYVLECQVEHFIPDDTVEKSLVELKGATEKTKRIVLIEIWGMIIADGEIDASEEKMISYFGKSLQVSEKTMEELKKWALGLVQYLNDGLCLIDGRED